jgi:hypothetical protein
MDGLGVDASRFKTPLAEFEKKQRQFVVDKLSRLCSGRGFSQRVVSSEFDQITFQVSEERLRQAAFAGRSDAEVTLAGNDPQEPPMRGLSRSALDPILDNPRRAPLLHGRAATRPRSLTDSNVEAVEARATLKVLPGRRDKEKGRRPLVTEQGLRLNKAFLKIGSALFREAVTALAEDLATKKRGEPHAKERLGRIRSFARIEDENLRRALIELSDAIVQAKSRCW